MKPTINIKRKDEGARGSRYGDAGEDVGEVAALLDHQDAVLGVARELFGDDGSGGTGTNDDVVVGLAGKDGGGEEDAQQEDGSLEHSSVPSLKR